MMHPTDYQTYTECPAANCNLLPADYNALTRDMRDRRDIAAALLKRPELTLEQRSFVEMHLAQVNRWLKDMAAHLRDTKLARLRLLRQFS